MRKHFITGLAILLPVVVTIFIVSIAVNLLTRPFIGFVESTFAYYHLLDRPFLFLSAEQMIHICSRLLILATLFIGILLVGFFAKIVLFHYIFKFGNFLLHRIPIINKIYKATQDVMETVFHENSNSFSDVVLVPFPTKNSLSIGFVTNDVKTHEPLGDRHGNISVFIPATPNPTVGFMVLFDKQQLHYLDMTIEEAIRFIVSCGVVSDKFSIKKID